jgi:hypothetical protein
MTAVDLDVDGGEEAKEPAAMRWQAVEGFNCAPGLTPSACRVGIALISIMDARTRACFPSEQWLAASLNLSERCIVKAKQELRRAGLIDWTIRGGERHKSRYGFNWAALERLSEEAKAR